MNSSRFTSQKIWSVLLLLSFATFFNGCVKEQDITMETIPLPSPKELITTNVFGLVVDENEMPVVNAEVWVKTDTGFEMTTTDEEGNFKYFDVRVLREGAFLKVSQADKFDGFRKMNVTPNSYNYTKIKLLDKTIVGNISSTSGGTVSHPSSAKLKLAANSVRYENGGEYTGNVNVAMSWIDPTADDLPARMVGDLSGIDENGKEVVLGTYGMLNVELLADNGEELQLKDNAPATLSFPVPAEIQDRAPSTIPLWSYNEELGVWFEEGSATLQNGYYVGDVAHFSSWNCDYKGEVISVTGKVISRDVTGGNVVTPFLQIYIEVEGILNRGGFLDNTGEFEFYNFPANVEFTLTIKDRCDNIIFEEQFGPYANDTDLGTIVVQGVADNFITLSGSGVDCDDNVLEDGYIQFKLENLSFIYPLEDDGTFEFVVNVCDETTGTISVIDVANVKESPEQSVDLLSSSMITIGELKACDELSEFVNIELNGEAHRLFLDPYITFSEQGGIATMVIGSEQVDSTGTGNSLHYLYLSVSNVTGVGTYNDVSGSWGNEFQELDYHQLIANLTTMEITQYGESPGDIIRGIITGEATKISMDGTTEQVTVVITFKIII